MLYSGGGGEGGHCNRAHILIKEIQYTVVFHPYNPKSYCMAINIFVPRVSMLL